MSGHTPWKQIHEASVRRDTELAYKMRDELERMPGDDMLHEQGVAARHGTDPGFPTRKRSRTRTRL